MDWSTILTSLGLSAATVTAIVVFGGKTLVNQWAERGKIKLQKKLDEQLETHKADLVRTTNDLQERLRIEYGSLYKERLDAIKGIYEKLSIIDRFLQSYNGLPENATHLLAEDVLDIDRQLGSIATCLKNLDDQVGNALIYFSENDANKLSHIVVELNKLSRAIFGLQADIDEGFFDGGILNNSVAEMKKADIPQAIDSVRRLFRQLIGVESAIGKR